MKLGGGLPGASGRSSGSAKQVGRVRSSGPSERPGGGGRILAGKPSFLDPASRSVSTFNVRYSFPLPLIPKEGQAVVRGFFFLSPPLGECLIHQFCIFSSQPIGGSLACGIFF